MYKRLIFLVLTITFVFSISTVQASTHAKLLSNLGANDIMFAQLMIPHHQQAIDMSNLALKSGASLQVRNLAKEIIAAQTTEIAQMKYWLTSAKAPASMTHDMAMNGMLSADEMKTLKTLRGIVFDKKYLTAMIAHHKGALEMVSYLKSTKNSEARKLDKDIRLAQSGEINSMKKMLIKLG